MLLALLLGCTPEPTTPPSTQDESDCGEGLGDDGGTCVPEASGTGTWGTVEGHHLRRRGGGRVRGLQAVLEDALREA